MEVCEAVKLFWDTSDTLTATAIAEVAGKSVLGNGLASQMRPRKYYMIRKESLERFTDDLEQLINFFIIEFQRIVFAENIYVTVSVSAKTQGAKLSKGLALT